MALTDLDTRVALAVQTPQVDFNQLLNNSLDTYNTVKGIGQQGILSRLLAQNTGADGQVNLANALQSAQTNPNQAYQSGIVNILSNSIQQQNAAKLKAQQEAEKQRIDNAETQSKTRKTDSETNLSQLNASAPIYDLLSKGSPKAALNYAATMNLRGLFSNEDYAGLVKQINENQDNPQALQDYGSTMYRSMLDPKFNIADANTVANNEASIANNIRTTNASIYSTDVGAQTADKNRAQQGEQFRTTQEFEQQKLRFEQNKGQVVAGTDGKNYIFYPSIGKYEPMINEKGEHIGASNAKGMTEQQSKDALFGARMQEANNILLDLEKSGISAPVMSHAGSYGESYAQVMPSFLGGASSKQQQYMQAQRDFINAVLRKESGAAIAESEFENARKQYFPQVGDSNAVIKQKAQNRKLALDMIINASGNIGKEKIQQATQSKQNTSSVNTSKNRQSLDSIF